MQLPRITNALTRLLDIEIPVICAPMAKVTSPQLVAKATLGGGYGFLAAGYQSTTSIKEEIASARSLLTAASYKEGGTKLPIGIAYFGWELDKYGDHEAHEKLNAALESNVQSIWLSFGNSFDKWVKYIRSKDQERPNTPKTTIFILVNNLAEARAAHQLGADVIVAQGNEAGGHGSASAPPVISLVSSILDALPEDNRPPIVAAGGFSTGGQVAAMLTLGASGAALGTRFILTPESRYSAAQKAALVAADGTATKRSIAWDQARNTIDWPDGIDGRGIYNTLVKDFESGVEISYLRQKVAENINSDDTAYQVVWSGTGVGEMSEVKGAKDIMHELRVQIIDRLQSSQTLVEDSRPIL